MSSTFAFDWVRFLEEHRVEFVHSGPNIGRGEVGVKCPFCGASDPSHHMSINLEGRGWLCRRNRAEHRGKSPVRLVRALIGCTAAQAHQIVGTAPLPTGSDILTQVEALVGAPADEALSLPSVALSELPQFKIFDGKPSSRPFLNYLRGRGFSTSFVERASRRMGLRYCVSGPFAGRVVFLVYIDGALVSWTGRSISPNAYLRYRALSADVEKAAADGLPRATRSVEQCLLWYDDLMQGGETLFLVEGPLDALKLRALGQSVTCLFTNSPSRSQVDLLRDLAPRFSNRVVLLDRGAEAQELATVSTLSALGFRPGWLPSTVDDPGELTDSTLAQIVY